MTRVSWRILDLYHQAFTTLAFQAQHHQLKYEDAVCIFYCLLKVVSSLEKVDTSTSVCLSACNFDCVDVQREMTAEQQYYSHCSVS